MLVCITVNDIGTDLVVVTPEDAEAMEGLGWRLYRLGPADPGTTPGVLARHVRLDPIFRADLVRPKS